MTGPRVSAHASRKDRELPPDVLAMLVALRGELAQVPIAKRGEVTNAANGALTRFYDGTITLAEVVSALAGARARVAQLAKGGTP